MQNTYYPLTPNDYVQYERKNEKTAIHQNATRVGFVLLIALGVQIAVVFADVILGMILSQREASALSYMLFDEGMVGYMLCTIAEYVLYMGIPVIAGWLLLRKRGVSIAPCRKTDGSLGVGLVLLGFGMMVVANIIGTYILTGLDMIGVVPVEVPDTQDGTLLVLLLNILAVGILPALLEELLFRGVILQGLRCAGDRTALVGSAFLFGLMHGTLYQIPFAFILGLVFGYITLKTGNILWTMFLHAANNTLSVLMEYWLWGMEEKATEKWYLLFFAIEALIGVIGAAVLMIRGRSRVEPVGDRISSWLTRTERRRAACSAATIIIFVVIMCLATLGNTRFEGMPDVDGYPGNVIAQDDEQQSARILAEVLR